MKKDVAIIGAGPGGYVAAIRLGQLGKSVVIIDRDRVGGVCLNWGCIPSKALIHAAKVYEEASSSEEMGIQAKSVSIDLKKTQAWKNGVVKKLTGGVAQLLKAAGVETIKGEAKFKTRNKLEVTASSGKKTIEFENAIIATGSSPISIPGFEIDGKSVVDSKDALDWEKAPKRMLVIGGGVIGMEMGMLYAKFGTHVTVVEMMDQLLPDIDVEIAQTLQRICRKRGIDVHLSSKALKQTKSGKTIKVEIETPKGKKTLECDVILSSVGRRPNAKNLGLEDIDVKIEKSGHIPVNEKRQTNVKHIYAIGDVTGPPLLAHKASKEGLVAAGVIAGHKDIYDVRAMPGAIFTDPEIAVVGMSEHEAEKDGHEIHSAKFPYAASGRALASEQKDGFVKMIADKKTGRLLGVHIIGSNASDLISEGSLGLELGAFVEDIALTVHPHPTFSETLMEAAEAAIGKPIHTVLRGSSPAKKERKHA